MTAPPRLLLDAVCDLIPPADAARIRRMDPDDSMTFVEAYLAARDSAALTSDLKHALLRVMFAAIDAEVAGEARESTRAVVRFARAQRSAPAAGPSAAVMTPEP